MKIKKSTSTVSFFAITVLMLAGFFGCDSGSDKETAEENGTGTGNRPAENNTLTKEEKDAGWRLLFDGKTFEGWRALGRESIPGDLWEIDQGAIHKINTGEVASLSDGRPAEGGDLMTNEKFNNYELYFEWRVETGGNTGLKYNVSEEMSLAYGVSALGFEYQLGDDSQVSSGSRKPSHLVGSLYDLFPTKAPVEINSIEEFN